MVRILLKHPKARTIRIWNDPLMGMMREVIDKVIGEEQLFGKTVKASGEVDSDSGWPSIRVAS